jgi:hypothetical protein
MKKLLLFICILVTVILFGCQRNRVYHKDGYILFDNLEFFQFVPVKNMNLETSTSSFYSENLREGFQFMSRNNFFDTVYAKVDTFTLENRGKDSPKENQILKIVPVHIDYKMAPEIAQSNYHIGILPFTSKIRGKTITFLLNYDVAFDIIKITPLQVKKRNRTGPLKERRTVCPI